jgi:phage terminase small subunit
MSGRPKPTAQKRATGNPGRRPLPEKEPEPPDGEVKKPAWLKHRAAKIWKEYAPMLIEMRVLTIVDVPMFALWCSLYAEYQETPQIFTASKISKMESIASRFGMDPSSRARMGTPPKNNGNNEDPAEKYFTGPKAVAG